MSNNSANPEKKVHPVVIEMSNNSANPKKKVHPVVTAYLTVFNLISAAGWVYVFYICVNVMIAAAFTKIPTNDTAGTNFDHNKIFTNNDTARKMWGQVELPLKVAQTMAILEIIHSLLKFTPNKASTVIMQVTSRIWALWFCMDIAPNAQESVWFILACVSWSLVEVPKYLFYVFKDFKDIELLKAYRYNAFYVLYPTGISGELGCMYESYNYLTTNQSISIPLFKELAAGITIPGNILLYMTVFIAFVYLPGSPFMIMNMHNMKKKAYEPVQEPVKVKGS